MLNYRKHEGVDGRDPMRPRKSTGTPSPVDAPVQLRRGRTSEADSGGGLRPGGPLLKTNETEALGGNGRLSRTGIGLDEGPRAPYNNRSALLVSQQRARHRYLPR